jgi:hypothetical protein
MYARWAEAYARATRTRRLRLSNCRAGYLQPACHRMTGGAVVTGWGRI